MPVSAPALAHRQLDKMAYSAFAPVEQWLRSVNPQRNLPDPVAWAERVSGTKLDPWQIGVLRSQHPALLLLTSRQVGKSFVVSIRAAYRAKYMHRRVGILSPTLRQ